MYVCLISSAYITLVILGCVTWTSWGSKLETIFSPVFAQMPNIKGFPVFTTPDTPLAIDVSEAVSAKDLATWRDVLSFKIKGMKGVLQYCIIYFIITFHYDVVFNFSIFFSGAEKPLHGKISEFSKDYGTMTYTPKTGNLLSYIDLI